MTNREECKLIRQYIKDVAKRSETRYYNDKRSYGCRRIFKVSGMNCSQMYRVLEKMEENGIKGWLPCHWHLKGAGVGFIKDEFSDRVIKHIRR